MMAQAERFSCHVMPLCINIFPKVGFRNEPPPTSPSPSSLPLFHISMCEFYPHDNVDKITYLSYSCVHQTRKSSSSTLSIKPYLSIICFAIGKINITSIIIGNTFDTLHLNLHNQMPSGRLDRNTCHHRNETTCLEQIKWKHMGNFQKHNRTSQ